MLARLDRVRRHRLAALALLLVFLPDSIAQGQNDNLQDRLSEVLEELNTKQDWIGQADRKVRDLQESVRTADKEVADAGLHIAELQGNISNLESRIGVQEQQAASTREKMSKLTSSVKWHINLAYRLQRRHWLRAFLEHESVEKNDRFVKYHRYFVNSKTDSIQSFSELLSELQATIVGLRNDRELLENQELEWANQKAHYNEESESRKIQIARLNDEISDTQQEVSKLLEDRQRLENLLAEIELASDLPSNDSDMDAAEDNQSELPWPTKGRVLVDFGDSRADGRLKWQGVHIASETGSDVVAVAPGKIVFADWLRGFGMMIVVDHGDDLMSVYGYCDALLARFGDNVEAGETIGTVGQSGGQNVSGLYFEVRSKGKSIDPIDWLEGKEP